MQIQLQIPYFWTQVALNYVGSISCQVEVPRDDVSPNVEREGGFYVTGIKT